MITCSSIQFHNSAPSLGSVPAGFAVPRRAQGIKYCYKAEISDKGRNSNDRQNTPAHLARHIPVLFLPTVGSRRHMMDPKGSTSAIFVGDMKRMLASSDAPVRTTILFCHVGRWRIRSESKFPGFSDVETIPWTPYLRASSLENTILPYQRENLVSIWSFKRWWVLPIYSENIGGCCLFSSWQGHLSMC